MSFLSERFESLFVIKIIIEPRFAHGTGHCNLIGPYQILVMVKAPYTDVPRPSRVYVEGLASQTTIVADRQAWQLFTKTFPDNSFFDSVYQRALETFVLSLFSIKTLITALVQAF